MFTYIQFECSTLFDFLSLSVSEMQVQLKQTN